MNYQVTAEVHKKLKNGYRLKVIVSSLGMYINGFRVLNGRVGHKWWVIPPQTRAGSKFVDILEFDKSQDLWLEINEACIGAIENLVADDTSYTDLSDKDFNSFISNGIDDTLNNSNDSKAVPWLKE